MKIVLIGAGSYVFAPTVLRDAIVKHCITGELALVDLNLEAAEAMAGVGRRMAQDLGVACTIRATDDRRVVLPGADAVILSAAPEGRLPEHRPHRGTDPLGGDTWHSGRGGRVE